MPPGLRGHSSGEGLSRSGSPEGGGPARRRTATLLIVVAALAVGAAGAALLSSGLPKALLRFLPGRAGARLVIVGVDGADWNVIDPLLSHGQLPNLSRLIERGARGRLYSLQPMLSPVLWTTVATGVRADKHGIVDFVAVSSASGDVVPVTSDLRRSPALWNILSEAGITVGVTAWWATYPAERVRGYVVSDRIAYQLFGVKPDDDPEGKTYPPGLFADIRRFMAAPSEIGAEQLSPYLGPGTAGRPPGAEEREIIEQLKAAIASAQTYRSIGSALSRRFSPDVEMVYFQNTDTISHLMMRYREPLLPGVDPVLARRFAPAVDESYREADRFLGEVVERAGDGADIIVCSDHGFRTGVDRPVSADSRIDKGKAAEWHRKYGVLVMAGPHVRRGAEVTEASLLDIAPTALALLGQPVPTSMEGRALVEAIDADFLKAHPIRAGPQPEWPEAPEVRSGTSGHDRALIEKLIALGYLTQDSLNARNNRGIMLMNRGEFPEAIAEFEAALAAGPDQAGILANLGRCQWLAGQPALAKATLGRALRLAPDSREAANLLGNISMSLGEMDEAERLFRKALEIEPEYTDAHNSLGILYENQSRWQDALAEYRRVVEVDPDYAEGYNNIGNVLRKMGRGGEAESWYRKALEADPLFAGTYNNLALVLQERGELAEAERLYTRALELAPREPRTHNNLGSLHLQRGRTEQALEEFKTAARLDPEYAEARNSLGVAYGKLGQPDEEIGAYREALRLNPSYPDARYNLGLALLRRGDAAGGRSEMERVLRIAPSHAPTLLSLTSLLLAEGDAAGAERLARRAVTAAPASGAARAALGQAMAASGDRGGARRELARALELDPSLSGAREALQSLNGER